MAETVLLYLLMYIEYASFCYVAYRKKPAPVGVRTLVGGVLVLAGTLFAAWRQWNNGMPMAFSYLLILILLYSLFGLKLPELAKIYFSGLLILTLAEITILFIFKVWGNLRDVTNNILYTVIVIVGIWLYHVFFGAVPEKGGYQIPAKLKVALGLAMAAILLMVSYFLTSLFELRDQRSSGLILVCGVAGIFILMLFLSLYSREIRRQQLQNERLKDYQRWQEEYYENLLAKENETRQFRHDMINHLMELQSFLEGGEYGKVEAYLARLLDGLAGLVRQQYDVGNAAINVMLNHYLAQAPPGCKVRVEGYVAAETGIEDMDLCTIVSNLAKNAVEAVSALGQPKTGIRFAVSQGEQYLRIYAENDAVGELRYDREQIPLTTKDDPKNHGYGIRSVKSAVAKYGGSYEAKLENGLYQVEVILKTDRSRGKSTVRGETG